MLVRLGSMVIGGRAKNRLRLDGQEPAVEVPPETALSSASSRVQ